MKAARYYGIHDVRFEEIEKPACGPNEALIKVSYAGICGSDLHIYNKGMFKMCIRDRKDAYLFTTLMGVPSR